jgi:hypothetical protein
MENLNKEKIVIYGAGRIGQIACAVLKELCSNFDDKILGYAVTHINNNPNEIEEIEVHDLDYYVDLGVDIKYLIAVREKFKNPIIEELKNRNISNYEIFEYSKYIKLLEDLWKTQSEERFMIFKSNKDEENLSDEEYLMFLSRQLKKGFLNFEINLADHCNLNCQCCSHFSPIAEKHFVDCVQLERDLKRLYELVDGKIGKVLLIGGEPLLHPDICNVLRIARKCLPESKLDLMSNGLLIPKMNEEFWQALNDLNIGLMVTKYPINFDYDACEKLALEKGIVISYGALPEPVKTTSHLTIKDENEFNPYQMYMKCDHANECVVLREGRMYTCPFAANIHQYNKYYNKHIPSQDSVSIDIYGVDNWGAVEEYLKRPNKMCGHCDRYNMKYNIPWAVSKRNVKEWTM